MLYIVTVSDKLIHVLEPRILKSLIFCSCFLAIFLLEVKNGLAQDVRMLRGAVNNRGFNNIFPYVSGDGNTIIFMNDYSQDGSYVTMVARKERGGRWSQYTEITSTMPAGINSHGGHCLSFDGSTLYFSTRKGETVGGYDILVSTHDGSRWSNARNLGVPISSREHDGFPSLSPDGKQLYFARCQTMTPESSSGCKLFVSDAKTGRRKGWEEAMELGDAINQGNTLLPRMLSDNQTLVFASDRPGGKGGLDWYYTFKEGEEWTAPVNMSFINTAGDDLNFTMYYRPDKAITSVLNEQNNYNLGEIDVPDEFQPVKVVIKEGTVMDVSGSPVDADVRIRNFEDGETIKFTFPDLETGEYSIVIPEGRLYDFSVVPKRTDHFYYSELLDYQLLRNSRKENLNIVLELPSADKQLKLGALYYAENSADLLPGSTEEVKRLARVLKRSEELAVEIASFQDEVLEDTIPRTDLPEIRIDSVKIKQPVFYATDTVMSTIPTLSIGQVDSLLFIWNDTLLMASNDTLLVHFLLASLAVPDSVESTIVRTIYHNDLTQKRADKVAELLVAEGIENSRIQSTGYGDKGTRPADGGEDRTGTYNLTAIFKRK